MFYREIAPPGDAAHVVLSFWEFVVSSEAGESLTHEVFPDGCVSLLYYRNERRGVDQLLISGSSLETAKVRAFPADVYWGMRLSPAACLAFFRTDEPILNTRPLQLMPNFARPAGQLTEQLNGCKNFAAAVTVFGNYVRNSIVIETDAEIAEAVSFIEENQPQVKVSEVAAAVNLSVRQLERRFRRAAGITPKQYIRARRIRATAVALIENQSSNWANRAAEMGFADQAHLTHEFTAVTGNSPVEFAEKVSRIEHGEIIR